MPKTPKKFKKVRLFKVARELNVSIDTLIQHLEERGYASALTGRGVNAALTDEDAYLDLQETYAADSATVSRIRELREARRAAQAAEQEDYEEPAPVEPESVVEAPQEATPVEPEPVAEAPVEPAPVEKIAEPEPAAEPIEVVAPVVIALDNSEPNLQTVEAPVVESEPVSETQEVSAEPDVHEKSEAVTEPVATEVEEQVEVPIAVEAEVAAVTIEGAESEEVQPSVEAEASQPDEAPSADVADEQVETAVTVEAPVPAEDTVVDAAPESDAVSSPADADTSSDEETEENVISAQRYKLTGTKVIGKIDLKTVEEEAPKRKRKRKRKRKGGEADEKKPEASKTTKAPAKAPEKSAKSAKKKKAGKKKPAVDQQEVEKTLQDTLRDLEQGASRIRQRRRRQRREERAAVRQQAMEDELKESKLLKVTEYLSTGELANLMEVSVTDVIASLFNAGVMASINQRLDADTITFIADEFGFEIEFIQEFGTDDIVLEEDEPEQLQARAPVVTIMGHVDHGKTSLLDYIRSANVVAGESGGITQHIGAYHVDMEDGRQITFLDTPGHEAFTAMRARGAKVTDIVILVVAADDAVMPQTIEAINHARAGEVPLVVAVNKMDKANAAPQRVMQQLADHGVLVEQYGGKVQCAHVSAHTGEGVDDLLEKVLLEAELMDLQANPDRSAIGTVIESRLDKGRGVVATILVQNGTLNVGDIFIAGVFNGRVRAMFDERDHRVKTVGPAMPALILGFSGAPEVGDQFIGLDSEREAREVAQKRQQIYREQSLRQRKHITLDEIGRRLALGDFRELNLIVKADVGGSVEALTDALLKLSTAEVAVNIIHSGVGAIRDHDVTLAAASDAIIIGFQVRPTPGARALAEREGIDIRLYSIIYDAIAHVRDALEGLLSPLESEKTLGLVEVRETFRVPKVGTIAGCYVLEGRIHRSDKVRIIRDGVVIYDGVLASLQRFKDPVREVQSGYECGIGIANYNDIKIGDQFEPYEIVETKRTLEV